MKEILNENVSALKLEKLTQEKLLDNNINTLLDLCKLSRIELASLGFENDEIKNMMINLQLQGLDFKKNHAKKNSILH